MYKRQSLDSLQVEKRRDLVAVVADKDGAVGRAGGQDRFPLLTRSRALQLQLLEQRCIGDPKLQRQNEEQRQQRRPPARTILLRERWGRRVRWRKWLGELKAAADARAGKGNPDAGDEVKWDVVCLLYTSRCV